MNILNMISAFQTLAYYLSVWVGGGRDLDASDGLLPVLGKMIFSPSDFSLSTKSSTSFPLPTSLSALLGPLDLKQKGIKLQPVAGFYFFYILL